MFLFCSPHRYEDKEMQSSSQYFEQYKDYGFSNKLLNVPKVSLKPNQLTSSIVKWCTLIVGMYDLTFN